MKVEIKVPKMGESISEATIGNIIKPNGSQVNMDEEILELETDKVNQVIYAPQAGVLTITAKPGDVVEIGHVIGYIDSEGQPAKASPPIQETEKPQIKQGPPPAKPQDKQAPPPAAPPPPPKEQASQQDTGARARVSREDYLKGLQQPASQQKAATPKQESSKAKAPSEPVDERGESRRKMSRIRQVVARRLVEAQQTAAMLTTFNEVDMTQVMLLREKYKEIFVKEHGVKLGFMSFFIKAVTAALKEFPDFNSYIDGDEIVHREYFDIGVAVGTDRGLLVPVIRNCDKLSFAEIEKGIETFAKKAREGTIQLEDLQGGGFTITNGGTYGSLLSTPILNPPQPGILGMHKIMKRPVVIDDQIVIRSMMYLALSYDHRIVDGKEAVTFLVEIKKFLEDPARLVLEV